MTPKYTTATDLFGSWLADAERAEPPARYRLAEPFDRIDVRPGRLILFGGAPGAGKTAALVQIGIDLLRANPAARLLVTNVEMASGLLVDRIAARLAGVPITSIADRTLTPAECSRVRAALSSLEPLAGRLAFLDSPFSLEHVAAAGTDFGADVLLLDYIQRVTVGDETKDKREALETAVDMLRRFCDAGAAVLVAAAVARQKSATGSNYAALNLASFRGSSELEYGCDAAYLLVPDEDGAVEVQCEKNRYGPVTSFRTIFDAERMTFSPATSGLAAFDAATPAPVKKRAKGGRRCDA